LRLKPNEAQAHGGVCRSLARGANQILTTVVFAARRPSGECSSGALHVVDATEWTGGGKQGQMRHANPLDIDSRGCRRDLRGLLSPNFRPAAAHLRHLSALTMHCTTARAFLTAHHHARHTGHNRRGCGE